MVGCYSVVLATFNGGLHLSDQLRSIGSQSLLPSHIYIGDDGSNDTTIQIILDWIKSTSIPTTYLPSSNHRLGIIRNFERLLCLSSSNYVMLSDQDDIWHPDKAVNLLSSMRSFEKQHGNDIPLLAYSDLQVVNSMGKIISPSYFRYQHLNPGKSDWLSIGLQNIVPGCSCVVNSKCIELSLPFPHDVIMHDWWLALVASSSGKIIYFPKSTIDYRQHANNVVGAISFSALFSQYFPLLFNSLLIDRYVGDRIFQLQACAYRFKSDRTYLCSLLRDLESINPFERILAALRLRLKKHGILRTVVFYILLILWKPNHRP